MASGHLMHVRLTLKKATNLKNHNKNRHIVMDIKEAIYILEELHRLHESHSANEPTASMRREAELQAAAISEALEIIKESMKTPQNKPKAL